MNIRQIKFALLILACCFFAILNVRAQNTAAEKHIEISLRMIGHQVLLAAGDSTSRVLPIVKEAGRYRIAFGTELALRPDELVTIVNEVVAETKFATSYILEVEECKQHGIFYAYQVGLVDSSDIIPCRARELPKECYNLLITILDEPLATNIQENSKAVFQWKWFIILFAAIFLAVIGSVIYYLSKRKKPALPNPNWISLGKYHFDKLNAELILEEQRIELTSKEADLLALLYETVNTTVERDVLLNKVWGDEGDYIGRTLDVFISKLRKKLEFDERIKIVNVRGVGYKLVMDI